MHVGSRFSARAKWHGSWWTPAVRTGTAAYLDASRAGLDLGPDRTGVGAPFRSLCGVVLPAHPCFLCFLTTMSSSSKHGTWRHLPTACPMQMTGSEDDSKHVSLVTKNASDSVKEEPTVMHMNFGEAR